MDSQKLLYFQERLTEDFLCKLTKLNPTNETLTNEELIQYNLIRRDDFNANVLAHKYLIQTIVKFAFENFFSSTSTKKLNLDYLNFVPNEEINLDFLKRKNKKGIIEILEFLHSEFLNSEYVFQDEKLKRIKSKINLKETGSVYTKKNIAEDIVFQTIKNRISQNYNAEKLKILDFGCGTGRFYFAALQVLNEDFGVSKEKAIQNLYAIDLDKIALLILKLKILFETGIENLDVVNQNILHRNMLLTSNTLAFEKNNFFDFQKDFADIFHSGGFDAIISNPPYYLLKINKNKTDDPIYQRYYQFLSDKIKQELQSFRKSGVYKHSIEGMLNYYKLSIEMMIRLAKTNGEIGIICPSTLFGDASSTKLRKFILNKNQLRSLEFFSENLKLFENVSQATAIFYISKNSKTQNIEIKSGKNNFKVSYNLIKNTFPDKLEIPNMEEIGWGILKKLRAFKKLKEFKTLRNRRGEFDLLQFKKLITRENTNFRLIRGNMISSEKVDYSKSDEFVEIDKFIQSKSKEFVEKDFHKVRLICQQISNIDIAKRLKFVFCAENDILGNSCNYISSEEQKDLEKLQILLNSYILNWRFKTTSTNNHINNYELNELPLLDFTKFSDLLNWNELKNNVEIAKMYGLDKNEIEFLLKDFFEVKQIRHYL